MTDFYTIGIMTGNSLDAVDVVLTKFGQNSIQDIIGHTVPYTKNLRNLLLTLREDIKTADFVMDKISANTFFINTVNDYTSLVAKAVNELLSKSPISKEKISALGFHGQTCGHFPPSLAHGKEAWTIQVGNPQLLADLTNIPVIYDFRSDDVFNGGEGAPFAPLHNLHLAEACRKNIIFCNGGNTGNISIVSGSQVYGWDTGPFNHLADYLMRTHTSASYDKNGTTGAQGQIIIPLLEKLFSSVALSPQGYNFYLLPPPKSSDPSWYNLLPELDCKNYSFYDTLRTVEYLSTYTMFHSLGYLSPDLEIPDCFATFGGGWNNPLMVSDFNNLIKGQAPVLAEHQLWFDKIHNRLRQDSIICSSDELGYSGQYMEARIFADAAYCKIQNRPFSLPSTTGTSKPTICGVWCYPQQNQHILYNRAVKGWSIKA